ncbi:MAG: 50S ribosomal protein L5 [Candidatus Micrarchaeota archaeon]|nr:50S ribosomal protein L5 [Candidatus Micrarchaeota archaeon]
MADNTNPMRAVVIDKVTLNIGVGQAGAELENAKTLLQRLSGHTAIETLAHGRNPVFHIKKGDPIGAKTTLRGAEAIEFVKKALHAKEFRLSSRNFDRAGNFNFGVPEYIEFPGAKYDPKIGIIGFDVCVTLRRKGGWRVQRRRKARADLGTAHRLTKEEAIAFAIEKFGVSVS